MTKTPQVIIECSRNDLYEANTLQELIPNSVVQVRADYPLERTILILNEDKELLCELVSHDGYLQLVLDKITDIVKLTSK